MDSTQSFILAVRTLCLDDRTFDKNLLNQLAPLYRRLRAESTPLGASEVVIDLRQVRFMGPYAVLGILVLAEGMNLIFQKRVKILLPSYPEAPDCILWIAQSGFLEAVAPWADLEPLPLSGILPVRDDPSIIPVRVVETRKHYLDLVEELLEKIPVQLGSSLTTEECVRVVTMVSELCQNCLYFGKNEDEDVRAYAMFQAFRGTVKFAVADTGPGIPSTLKRKYHARITPWHDSLAIALAMKQGVSTSRMRKKSPFPSSHRSEIAYDAPQTRGTGGA